MRLSDLVAAATVAVACLVVVQATWSTPTIGPGEARNHLGERVQVEGILLDATWFNDAGRGRVAGDGAVLNVWFNDVQDVVQGSRVRLEGIVDQEGGLPLLRVDQVHVLDTVRGDVVSLAAIARNLADYNNREVQVTGDVDGRTLRSDGHAIRLVGNAPAGTMQLVGVVAYHPPCLCHVLVVADAWTL